MGKKGTGIKDVRLSKPINTKPFAYRDRDELARYLREMNVPGDAVVFEVSHSTPEGDVFVNTDFLIHYGELHGRGAKGYRRKAQDEFREEQEQIEDDGKIGVVVTQVADGYAFRMVGAPPLVGRPLPKKE